jgi:hypothetical protein
MGRMYETESEPGSRKSLRRLKVERKKENKLANNDVNRLGSWDFQNSRPHIGTAEKTSKTIPPDKNWKK